jgi:hypothetical protein
LPYNKGEKSREFSGMIQLWWSGLFR